MWLGVPENAGLTLTDIDHRYSNWLSITGRLECVFYPCMHIIATRCTVRCRLAYGSPSHFTH